MADLLALEHAFPKFDLLNDYENARALVEEGVIPVGGSVSSFGSVNPPGVGYGLVAGILLGGEDPGQVRRLSALFWFGVSLLGLWYWTRLRLGKEVAVVAVLLYGLGAPAIFYAVSVWPRAHPAFLIWLLYWVDRWCLERERGALAWVLGIGGLGCYWMLEFLPVWPALGVIWFLYRPPLDWKRGLLPGALLIGLIWSPYLFWQWERNWEDLRSLLTLEDLHPELKRSPVEALGLGEDWVLIKERPEDWDRYFRESRWVDAGEKAKKGHWVEDERFGVCWVLFNRTRVEGQIGNFFKPRSEPRWYFQAERSLRIWQKESGWEEEPHGVRLVDGWVPERQSRFQETDRVAVVLLNNYGLMLLEPLQGYWLWILMLCGLTLGAGWWRRLGEPWWLALIVWVPAGTIWIWSVMGLLFWAGSLASYGLLWGLVVIIPLGGLVWSRWMRGKGLGKGNLERAKVAPVLGLVLVLLLVPWTVNSLTVLGDGWSRIGRRYMWLYLLQAILVAWAWREVWRLWIGRRGWFGIGAGVLVFVTVFNGRTLFEWERSLWSVRDTEALSDVEIVSWISDYVAEKGGGKAISLGYDIPFLQFKLHWNAVDARYKVGRDYDVLLRDRFGVENRFRGATGISRENELILVDKLPGGNPALRFWDLRDFGKWQVIYEDVRWVVLEPGA